MEWERKFYDIIQETESNLAKAKRKLQGTSLSNSLTPLELPGPSQHSLSPLQPWMSTSHMNSNHCSSSHRPLDWSLPLTPRPGNTHRALSNTAQTSEMGELLTKIDSQNLMIDRLERLVRTLNQEKDQYRRHIKDLQMEVGGISSRLDDSRYMDPHLEAQVDLMRHEVRSDMQRLQNVISASKNSSLYSDSLQRSFKDMQQNVHAELEGIRRDLNFMTHRIGRLELDVSTHSVSQRDLQDRLTSSNMLTASNPGQLGHRSNALGTKTFPWMDVDAAPLQDIRSTVSQLHNKLDSLEGRIASSRSAVQSASPDYGVRRTLSKRYQVVKSILDDEDDEDSSDLDLSLSDDIDLELSSEDDMDDDLSEELDEIIKVRRISSALNKSPGDVGLGSPQKYSGVSVSELKSSALDDADKSWEGADLSDLDLDNLDLSSAGASVDLDLASGSSADLQLDDL